MSKKQLVLSDSLDQVSEEVDAQSQSSVKTQTIEEVMDVMDHLKTSKQ